SGINLKKLNEVDTMLEYSQPLIEFMEAISNEERIILVGHSLGGLNIAYAMEMFPEKVSVGVFLTTLMPDTSHRPSYRIRVGSTFAEDLSIVAKFSNEGYGSVNRIYIVCNEDKAIPEDFQRWMIENNRVKQVKEIKGSDHMAMI
ncbi:hypothetical protein IFM89_009047, partial [Coptis chinensis]